MTNFYIFNIEQGEDSTIVTLPQSLVEQVKTENPELLQHKCIECLSEEEYMLRTEGLRGRQMNYVFA
ncbi:hypothetical protein L2703_17045 [Shewanella basaltis]|uniref:hypothetical protein n=1 Tax=Shewanella basaltis TaxID=472183 RepID=UPI00200E20A9|nr:hypothetical protein [Shewanella basaltis]MCL1115288.1 hypothetical protein [Shewanella basaltis]